MTFLITQTGIGQFRSDTVISQRTLDSLQFVIFQQKETINEMHWTFEVKVNVKKVDTLKIRQDSIVVNHLSGEEKIIKQEILSYNNNGCLNYSVERYFNSKELVSYAESWKFSCTESIKKDDEKSFNGLRIHYERMKYDDNGRIVERVFWHSTPMTRRIFYTYDSSGKQNHRIERITEREFWD